MPSGPVCIVQCHFLTESYSEWKETFAKVTIDAKYNEYGDVIGEGNAAQILQPRKTGVIITHYFPVR